MTVSYANRSAGVTYLEPPAARAPIALEAGAGLASEWRTLLLPPRLLARAPRLSRVPRGDGGPVIDIPGWNSPEAAMAPLRHYLRRRGHDARGWGMGVNTGNPERDVEQFAPTVEALAEQGKLLYELGELDRARKSLESFVKYRADKSKQVFISKATPEVGRVYWRQVVTCVYWR